MACGLRRHQAIFCLRCENPCIYIALFFCAFFLNLCYPRCLGALWWQPAFRVWFPCFITGLRTWASGNMHWAKVSTIYISISSSSATFICSPLHCVCVSVWLSLCVYSLIAIPLVLSIDSINRTDQEIQCESPWWQIVAIPVYYPLMVSQQYLPIVLLSRVNFDLRPVACIDLCLTRTWLGLLDRTLVVYLSACVWTFNFPSVRKQSSGVHCLSCRGSV